MNSLSTTSLDALLASCWGPFTSSTNPIGRKYCQRLLRSLVRGFCYLLRKRKRRPISFIKRCSASASKAKLSTTETIAAFTTSGPTSASSERAHRQVPSSEHWQPTVERYHFNRLRCCLFWVGLSLACSRSMHFAVTENVADCNGAERQLL